MNHLKSILLLAVILLGVGAALAQNKLGPKDAQALPPSDLTRVKVGQEAPDFTLEKEADKPISLSDYRGKKTVVLVFYRGHW